MNTATTRFAVRNATLGDLDHIMEMVDHSRSIMRANGNNSQWGGYPGRDLIGNDITTGIGHVMTEGSRVVGYFAMLTQPEPTYEYIEDGLWLDDTTPYVTLHRLACVPGVQGIARCAFEWGEAHAPSVRVDTHLDNHIMLHIINGRGYTRCGVVYMQDGSPREAFQKMMYPEVNAGLKQYVEQEILPRYNHFDSAHKLDHVQKVMAQSMEIAHKLAAAEGSDGGSLLNMDMVYTIAAYHDTGVVEGREHHHTVSGRIIRQDEHLRQWFSEKEIETMAQAAEDHRASAQGEPRSLYGKIVAEADRDIEPTTIVRRTVQYGLSHYPDLDREGHWQRTLQHLNEKYAEGGYLKLFIPCSRNGQQLQKLRQLIADRTRLRTLFDQIIDTEREQQTTNP